jgi:predicted ArsR family transcriptional regulator
MDHHKGIVAAAALHDPVRRSLLELVSARAHPVTRDAAALALGVSRSTVAFHLDRLVEAGLLVVDYNRTSRRAGPGSGRPSKTYSTAQDELQFSFPERHYDLMADLLATAVTTASGADSALEALHAAASIAGRDAGSAAGGFTQLLASSGYEPTPGGHGTVLANCPFRRLARDHTAIICEANHSFLSAAAEATGHDPAMVILEPTTDGCCVRIAG